MAGIYIHIPFCRKACHYCDFHFSTSLKHKTELLDAMHLEIENRAKEITEPIETIYFGGGTPSVLQKVELLRFLDQIHTLFNVSETAEITLEANPDDLTTDQIKQLKASGINRLSIGIQSFRDKDLVFMNRSHNSKQALECVSEAQHQGIENISIDLIYGVPGMDDAAWQKNLEQAFALNVPHLSSYNLTVEPNTALDHMVKKGKVTPVDEAASERHFRMLNERALEAGFEHYEISNLALPGQHSRHNSNYWLGKNYLGIGPSAHSFDGLSRSWNVAHNLNYIKGLQNNSPSFQSEKIDTETAYNEYVLTRLRTKWGCLPSDIEKRFGATFLHHFEKELSPYLSNGCIKKDAGIYKLSIEGMLLADRIASDLFF